MLTIDYQLILTDLGGGWFAEVLTRIYRPHVGEVEIETIPIPTKTSNPFTINLIIKKTLSAAQVASAKTILHRLGNNISYFRGKFCCSRGM